MIGKIREIVVDCSVSEFKEILKEMKFGNWETVAEKVAKTNGKKIGPKPRGKSGGRKMKNIGKYQMVKKLLKKGGLTKKEAIAKVFKRAAMPYDYIRLNR